MKRQRRAKYPVSVQSKKKTGRNAHILRSNMKMDSLPAKKNKTAQKPAKQPLRDVFTVICKTDLKQDCEKEFRFHPVRKWRFDYALPEHKIALEVEGGVWTGGRHTSSVGFLNDMEKYNTATLMGWRVFRTTPEDLYKKKTLDMLKTAISGHFDP